jgi:hypothetical protein
LLEISQPGTERSKIENFRAKEEHWKLKRRIKNRKYIENLKARAIN